MVQLIKDLWILTESGTTVFSRVLDPRINPQLFGALMSAINIFAEKLGKGGISNFEVSKIKFSIIKEKNFLFVVTSSKTIKSKKIYNELKYISTRFFELYPKEMLEKWNSDVGLFATFSRSIKGSLEED
ncbi:MAG: hypothetical protein Lokiarch_15160 [Candidatus Lokiarchaeum sp. GC14_75]|nr:MAG: hypothetical protein Lokiarch_15160 [Candidatus Lokiarchaeum sp. GC14_75]